jgi:hypothetical protein
MRWPVHADMTYRACLRRSVLPLTAAGKCLEFENREQRRCSKYALAAAAIDCKNFQGYRSLLPTRESLTVAITSTLGVPQYEEL